MSSYRAAIGLAVAALVGVTTAIGAVPGVSESKAKHAASASDVVPRPLQVLTIGDSIMNGYGLPPGQAWPFLVAANDGWTLTNDACDGAGVITIGSPEECDSNFAGVVDSVSALNPDIVIFEGSSNDLGQDNSALLTSTIAEVQELRAEFPSAQIVGLNTLWGYTDPPAQLAQINSQVQQAVQSVGGTYLNIGQPMSGHPELMQYDDVHPNASGQAVLASAIETALHPVVSAAVENQLITASRIAHVQELIDAGRLS
jgi:acyl-CoA thioesterase I